MMAKKIADLEAKMEEVWKLLEGYLPEQYEMHEGPLEKASELCQGWNYAMFGIIDATCRVGELAKMLRAKAGINEEDFRAAYRAERLAKMAGKNEQRENPQAQERRADSETATGRGKRSLEF
ncbi:MAG: hypothetical protein IID34_14135 [Planctomycetes bacterium]|nr:hypothetical protein [Planctomycetota bacterium]